MTGLSPQTTEYAELAAMSNFSFLRGAAHPDELVFQAAALGLSALALTDRNTLAGAVRAHKAAKEADFRFVVGARLCFTDGTPDLFCYPTDRNAYGRLCKLLTLGKRRAPKGECELTLEDALTFGEGQLFALRMTDVEHPSQARALTALRAAFPKNLWIALARQHRPDDRAQLARLAEAARASQTPLLAVGDVLYHAPERRMLQDILHCIREHVSLERAGRRLEAHAERHIKPPQEMARLFRDHPAAVIETRHLLERAQFSLDEIAYEYPDEIAGGDRTSQDALVRLTWRGAKTRYPKGVPNKVRANIEHELTLIGDLDYAPYFLTVHDLVRFAREKKILCQGRGSAANSSVCYCLGVTSVDPNQIDLLFERFVSAERNEPPDIDVDFEHERREEVIQYIYEKYGRHRAGIAATVITYRSRSAVREVGKVFGLSEDLIGALAGSVWGWSSSGVSEEDARKLGYDPQDDHLARVLHYTRELIGFPRHLSQHVGGFVMTRGPLEEIIPIANAAMADRTFVEWDKDDLATLGILKVDVLALGMLTCIAKSFDLLSRHYGIHHDLASIPQDEPEVYDMLCRADSVGVFQVESRAQMSMLPRLRPRTYYDLVIEVAIVRPGPIQGDMVHPYLRRRNGEEDVDYPSKELEDVLAKTMGVPLFQEQAMKIAIVAAGFTPSEADQLRRAMATFRNMGTIHAFGEKMVAGMRARGYEADFAERCFKQIEGFGDYGFPESHAASFALLVYVSSWIKCHYPDVFCCAILNSQPMGFYAPAQLVRDAREHGVVLHPVDINCSDFDNTLEGEAGRNPLHARHQEMNAAIQSNCAVRLGFRQIKGLSEAHAERITALRGAGYDSVRDLWLRTGLGRAILEKLADADAFRSLGLDRRDALWAVRGLDPGATEAPLFAHASTLQKEAEVRLPAMPLGEHVAYDYKTLRLSLKAHPTYFVRDRLKREGYQQNEALLTARHGARMSVAGLVLVRQRPGSAKGVVFATLEDETGVANAVIWPKAFEKHRSIIIGARFIGIKGRVQREGEVIHLVAQHIENLTPLLSALSDHHEEMDAALAHADEVKRPVDDFRQIFAGRRQLMAKRMKRILPKGRNFH